MLAREQTVDVVVLNLAMAGVAGIDSLTKLRATAPYVAVVVVSESVGVPTAVQAMRSGANDVLDKPVGMPSLLQLLRRAVARVRHLREERHSETLAAEQTALLYLHRARVGAGPVGLSAEATTATGSARWPGNVHQMWETLQLSAAEARDESVLDATHLPIALLMNSTSRQADGVEGDDARTLEDVERPHIERVLLESGGNRTIAAKSMGISRGTL